MQPNGNGSNGFVTNLKSVFSIANPIIMVTAAIIVLHTNATVQTAVQGLRKEIQEQTANMYESREAASMARSAIQERLELDRRERDELHRLYDRLDERIRSIETRK